MNRSQRSGLVMGIFLILLGGLFLAWQLGWLGTFNLNWRFSWPLIVIGVGVLILVLGLASGEPDSAIPAVIVGGIGGILYWQNATNSWASWSYIWALIPGLVGVGMLCSWLLGNRKRGLISEATNTILVSLVLFAIFGSFFGAFNGLGEIQKYWPLLLVLIGLYVLVRGFVENRNRPQL